MHATRRMMITAAGMAPFYSIAGNALPLQTAEQTDGRMLLSDFTHEKEFVIPGAAWRGFSDRVMGGVSNAKFRKEVIDGRHCARMTGNVTRDNGGGFIQMALDFKSSPATETFSGFELLVYGNDEDYNAHIRTGDCGWYDQSYRVTFRAEKRWQTIQLPWSQFEPNGINAPLDTSNIQRLGLLGWMRDFDADLALGAVSLYT
jgi:hypothetical protein